MKLFIIALFILLQSSLLASDDIEFTKNEIKYLKSNPVVTIGSMDNYSPFNFIRNGKQVGLTQDLIEILSKKTGLKFKKYTGSWSKIYNKFRAGKLDMISEISYKKERLPFTNYTNPYYEIPIGVFTKKGFGTYKGIDSFVGKKVGIIKDSYLIDTLKNHKGIELVLLNSTDEKFHALSQKTVDVILGNVMSLHRLESLMLRDIELSGYYKQGQLKNEDLRFGIKKDKLLLSSIINKTLDAIPYSTITSLRNRWILRNDTDQNNINFTKTEQYWINNNQIIIGIEEAKPYIYFDKNTKKIDGLYADILKVILNKTGLQAEYVTGEWTQLLQNFKKNKIDLLPATFYKKSRESFGNFTTDYYKVREYIYTKENNENINTFKDLANTKIAIVANYATIAKIKEKIPSAEIVKTKNLEKSFDLLQTGQVDALIDYHLVVESYIRDNFIVGLKSIIPKELEPFSVHYFSNINKPILQSILQKGLDNITREEKNDILKSWIRIPYTSDNIQDSLTTKELKFMKEHPTVRFKVRPNRAPFEFIKNGKIQGIAIDYVKKSAQNIGLNVKFVIDDSTMKDSYKMIETTQKKFDSLLFSVKDEERAERFSFGKAFLSYPMMIITNKEGNYINSLDDLKNQKIVIEEGFLTNKWIKRDYPKSQIINVSNTQKALELVNKDKNVVYVGNLAVANYMGLYGTLNNIKIVGPSPYGNIKYSFIAPKKWPELALLLSKGFSQISSVEHSEIQQKWFSLQTIEKTNYTLAWKILFVGILIIIWILWWNRKITLEKNKTKEALEKLQKAQYNLEEKTQEQLEQQKILFNQSKIASMGEMIGNIAHQWRQPLSIISTASTGLLMEKKFNVISDEKLERSLNIINDQAQYLSQTINTFSNYIKSNKQKQKVILQDSIQVAMDIVKASFQNNYIKIDSNLDTTEAIKVDLISSEFSEVLINILNNAKDVLKQNNIKDPWVKINLKKVDNKAIICIEDNGGGIPENLLTKIFEPYFTTKHQSQGTGLGLHMSYKIVKESLKGNIYAKNGKDGAQFYIEFPLNKFYS
jgi:ABC-type amino acid transport substrate-binding protein/nitrogen-specific signal transduction histidine kinase